MDDFLRSLPFFRDMRPSDLSLLASSLQPIDLAWLAAIPALTVVALSVEKILPR